MINQNSIQLQWSNTADNIRGYHVFRNNVRITNEMLTITTYLDENLPDGKYKYYVRAYYQEGCVSDSSNHVKIMIGEETCEAVNDLTSEKINDNSVLLTWSEPEEELQVEGYHLFRNNTQLTEALLTNTSYMDENLPNGNYEYCVATHYANGCISELSNCVEEEIKLSITEFENRIEIYPNPTSGQLTISLPNLSEGGAYEAWKMENIEILDVFGRVVYTVHPPLRILPSFGGGGGGRLEGLDISHLASGIYFLRITTETEIITRKIIKN
jgi:hypothetical protein